MENIVEFKNVNKCFGRNKVIENATFKIKKNSICGFIGPNGAGKTTLIKLLLDIIPVTSGEILVSDLDNYKSKGVGAIVGSPSYYGNLNAYKNLKVVYYMKNLSPNDKEISELLKLVGLEDVANKKVKNFSMGMKQRLCIAISLVGNPQLLIWDEPINGLDPEGIIEVRNLIMQIHKERNVTFLIASHILNELDKVVDEIVVIKRGKIMYSGGVQQFLTDCEEDTLEDSYMKCINRSDEL